MSMAKADMSAYDFATLRMAQAKALVECVAVAAAHGDSEVPTEDAAWGIIALLDEASAAFGEERIATRGTA